MTTFNQASLHELTIKINDAIQSDMVSNAIAKNIVQNRPFKCLKEVLTKTEGLGDKRMLKIIDRWLYSQ